MLDPVGHSKAAGQISPVTPSVGVEVFALSAQKWPSEQGPVGASSPAVSQNDPPLHGVHSSADLSPVREEKVPIGQGSGSDAFGQN